MSVFKRWQQHEDATRALLEYAPLRYHRRQPRGLEDRHTYAQVTRFLPPEVRSHFDERTPPAEDERWGDPVAANGSSEAVGAFLADLWE